MKFTNIFLSYVMKEDPERNTFYKIFIDIFTWGFYK
jgi:hypothetical protein